MPVNVGEENKMNEYEGNVYSQGGSYKSKTVCGAAVAPCFADFSVCGTDWGGCIANIGVCGANAGFCFGNYTNCGGNAGNCKGNSRK
jgi:hypothetical protein